ncbi:MAG: M20 family metallopeptidase [Sedimentibacter sp.]
MKTIFFETSDYIYNNPELGNNEHKSSKKLINLLMEHGFSVENGIVGRITAFKAVFDSKKPGPTVAYLCEYDALPEIGHGCGHNIIGTSSAAEPEKGINALDGVLQLFSGINALRQHVKSDVRIHGIIKEGGIAPNVVPDKAVARFYVRAKERTYLNEVVNKIKDIAYGAALITGSTVEIVNYEASYDNLITNQNLSRLFSKNLRDVGVTEILEPRKSFGSIDMGNVSHVTPAIHPYLSIGKKSLTAHTKEMADATITSEAHEMMLKGIMALAMTGYDILADKELYQNIKDEFNEHKAAK